jgi:hypothetical protein
MILRLPETEAPPIPLAVPSLFTKPFGKKVIVRTFDKENFCKWE